MSPYEHTDRWRHRTASAVTRVAILVAALGCPAVAQGQWGASAGIRSVGGQTEEDRNGVELRGLYDRPLTERISWRGELTYTQMRTPASDAVGRYTVNENGFEFGVSARLPVRVAIAQAYLLAGPVASFRATCGVDSHFDSNGLVPCAGDRTSALGWQAGLGLAGLGGGEPSDLDWSAELRLMRGTVAASGGSLVAISVGVRRR